MQDGGVLVNEGESGIRIIGPRYLALAEEVQKVSLAIERGQEIHEHAAGYLVGFVLLDVIKHHHVHVVHVGPVVGQPLGIGRPTKVHGNAPVPSRYVNAVEVAHLPLLDVEHVKFGFVIDQQHPFGIGRPEGLIAISGAHGRDGFRLALPVGGP